MLYLVGIGIKPKDITLKGLEILRAIDEIYLDTYTVPLTEFVKENIAYLENVIGKKIKYANREFVELELERLAKEKDIALLTVGDPLFATTHLYQFRNILKEIVHAPSILNYTWRVGLSPYKFGRVITDLASMP